MATIFGGERLLNLIRISDTSVSTSGVHTFYTVPSGQWAVVELEYLTMINGSGTTNGSTLAFGPTSFSSDWEVDSGSDAGAYGRIFSKASNVSIVANEHFAVSGPVKYLLLSGETVVSNEALVTKGHIVILTVKEYANP